MAVARPIFVQQFIRAGQSGFEVPATGPQPGPTCECSGFGGRVAGEKVGDGSRSAQHCSVNEKAASSVESACCHVAEADARTREENQLRTGGHRAADALDAPRRPLFREPRCAS